ncbi:MAG: hypothetical protein OEX12_03835 [Gammaproteobacteria bacterium]|nr:hypothetical protein [Gammaproteobacteria bacterium]
MRLYGQQMYKVVGLLSLPLYFAHPLQAANPLQCHIHPPQMASTDAVATLLGPYSGREQCEQERLTRFGHEGRCHCSFSSPLGQDIPGDLFSSPGMPRP